MHLAEQMACTLALQSLLPRSAHPHTLPVPCLIHDSSRAMSARCVPRNTWYAAPLSATVQLLALLGSWPHSGEPEWPAGGAAQQGRVRGGGGACQAV